MTEPLNFVPQTYTILCGKDGSGYIRPLLIDESGQVQTSGGGGGASTAPFRFYYDDIAYVTSKSFLQYVIAESAGTFSELQVYSDTAPTGAVMKIEIYKNGVSILSAPIEIAIGANSNSTTSFATTTFAKGDRISWKITQVGSTVAGADVAGTLAWTAS